MFGADKLVADEMDVIARVIKEKKHFLVYIASKYYKLQSSEETIVKCLGEFLF